MAEVGGSHTDDSVINLDSTRSSPGPSNDLIKAGALKRHADVDKNSIVKKRRSTEKQASSSKGRNHAARHCIEEEKMKRTREKIRRDRLELREKLKIKLKVLEGRDMELSDRAEEKMVAREDTLKKALIDLNKILDGDDTDENEDMEPLDIHIREWKCLDTYIQEFAQERLYNPDEQEKGVYMTIPDLMDVINKVRSHDPSVGLPSENGEAMEQLLRSVNWSIREVVRTRQYEHLMSNLDAFPGIDPKLIPEQKLSEVEEEERKKLFVDRMMGISAEEDGSEGCADVVNLDEEDSENEEKENDEDDNDEQVDEAEEEEEDEDLNMLRQLQSMDDQDGKAEERNEIDVTMGLTPPPSEENPAVMITAGNESCVVKVAERPDSRELEEGGTSTNSPTTDRDERLMELEKKDEAVMESSNGMEMEKEEDGEEGPSNPVYHAVADTIVLTDDEDPHEVQMIEKEVVKMGVTDGELEIGPPKPVVMTHIEASRLKMREVQKWINNCYNWPDMPEVVHVESEDDKEGDDEIECIHDDFDWDSVSHSGLPAKKVLAKVMQKAKDELPDVVEVIDLD